MLSVALTPDGKWVLSGSKDRGVQFWDPRTGETQLMLQGHKNSGTYLRFEHDEGEANNPRNIAVSRKEYYGQANQDSFSHLGGAQPTRRTLCDRKRRYARTNLEVSIAHSCVAIPDSADMGGTVRYLPWDGRP